MQLMQYTLLQPKQMLIQTIPYCLHAEFYRAQSVLQPYLTIFDSSCGATCLVISISIIFCFVSCQSHFNGLTHSPLSTILCDDISKTHAAVERLKCVLELQLSRNVESVLHFLMIFMYTKLIKSFLLLPHNRRSRIFSPACNMSSLSDANEKILNRFWNS